MCYRERWYVFLSYLNLFVILVIRRPCIIISKKMYKTKAVPTTNSFLNNVMTSTSFASTATARGTHPRDEYLYRASLQLCSGDWVFCLLKKRTAIPFLNLDPFCQIEKQHKSNKRMDFAKSLSASGGLVNTSAYLGTKTPSQDATSGSAGGAPSSLISGISTLSAKATAVATTPSS